MVPRARAPARHGGGMNADNPNTPAPTATLGELLANLLRNFALDLRVAAPAHVTAYDPATQRVTVQLGALPVRMVEGEEVPEPPIAIAQVPVMWLGGSLGYVTTPLVPGDTGLVVFADRSLSQWLLQGVPGDPLAGWTHALGDAVFIPGLRPTPRQITPPTSLAATVVEGPVVHAGPGAVNPVVKFTELSSAFSIWATAMANAGAAVASPGVPDPTGALYTTYAAAVTTATATLAATIASWASAKLLVQS